MGTLGKLLIVLVFIASIMFMAFAVVLYATHTNWKEKADALQKELDSKNKQLADRTKEKTAIETALKMEKDNLAAQNVALAQKIITLNKENQDAKNEHNQLVQAREAAVESVRVAHVSLGTLRARYDGASEALFKAQKDWTSMASELVKTMDSVHSYALQVTTYQAIGEQLAKDYRNAVEVLKKHNLKLDPGIYLGQPPVGVCGIITAIRPKGMVEISVGSDSGLAKGHQLDVVRNREGKSMYVGKIKIISTEPDRAVGEVLIDYRRGIVQLDDEVKFIDITEIAAP